MTADPAGWYRDPAPAHREAPSTLRYWDGKSWTAQVKQASRAVRREWAEDAMVARIAEARAAAAAGVPVATPGTVVGVPRDVTPDGAGIAGWGRRAVAAFLDGIIVGILGMLFSWRYLGQLSRAFGDYVTTAATASQTGGTGPDPAALLEAITGPVIGIVVVSTLVRIVYHVALLKAFQATPGKMMLGLEVRLRERPGVLSWATVLARVAASQVYKLLAVVPLLGVLLVNVYWLLDVLWPLWDSKRQALHDKVAKTNVVRR